ncbi:hypothetical protein BRC85_05230 [Halobacteriales archaeon QS_1_69_70]|nr:MAG: hypothetical protein BRC85_05230 [Halobacteriales archaeon QS_1_69_70]
MPDIGRDGCTDTAWDVDREDDSADADRRMSRRYRVPEGRVELQELARTPTDRLIEDVEDTTAEVGLPDDADPE